MKLRPHGKTLLQPEVQNIHFVKNVSQQNCDKQAFRKIQKSDIEKVLPKPRNKFVIARGIISRVIRKESNLSKLEDLSKVASIIWKKKRNSYFDKYFSYLSKMDEECNSRSYKDLVKRNKSNDSNFCNSTRNTIEFVSHRPHDNGMPNSIDIRLNSSVPEKKFRFKSFNQNPNGKGVSKIKYSNLKDSRKKTEFTYSKTIIDPFTNLEMEDVFLFKK